MITTDNAVTRHDSVEEYDARRVLPRIVTTSWDDGDFCDFRVAEMLRVRKLLGTFYVPITGHHGPRALSRGELRILDGEGFEIGGHGFSHLILPKCTKELVIHEVETCKARLEDILGHDVDMFAYPRGRHSGMVIKSVKQAGYAGARTTEMLAQDLDYDPYKMPTTIQIFPHSRSAYLRNVARGADFERAWRFIANLRQAGDWVQLAKTLFDSTLERGGVFHMYGHSWEIDKFGLWNDLEEVLDYVSGREGVLYLSNGSALGYRAVEHYINLEEHGALEG